MLFSPDAELDVVTLQDALATSILNAMRRNLLSSSPDFMGDSSTISIAGKEKGKRDAGWAFCFETKMVPFAGTAFILLGIQSQWPDFWVDSPNKCLF